MTKTKYFILIALFITKLYSSDSYKNEHFVEYQYGNLPIIISAPHGGKLKPEYIPNRLEGKKGRDKNSDILAKAIASKLYELTNKNPYVVILDIARKKVDANREIIEATQGNSEAKTIYETYHGIIKDFREEINNKFKFGLFFDIHGHSHPNAYIEFGYLLPNDLLKLKNEELKTFQNISSISALSNFSKENFISQLKGESSLSHFMSEKGYKTIPSIDIPYAIDDNYFKGAYNTKSYGSLNGGNIISIQVEFPKIGFRDNIENINRVANDFALSILKFFKIHYNLDLKD